MSERLRAQYPEQMTIILQHQFWDLGVNERGFEVGLSFGGIPEKLVDSVRGDQRLLRPVGAVRPAIRGSRRGRGPPVAGQCASCRTSRPRRSAPRRRCPPPRRRAGRGGAGAAEPETDNPDKPAGGGEVVPLDRFRKKK